ncbi:MAG: 16S rRNA (cytidine(1402)-2'-O)-methyltransferase [Patescibacteria group bacterium]
MFYIIPTPIGNLGDITDRAKEVLKSLDILYCENPQRTNLMLNVYGISIDKLRRYTEHNESKLIQDIIEEIKLLKNVGIVSDAGMPVISDPGYKLIRELKKQDIKYEVLPGASSILPALIYSGLPSSKFIFLGFLSKKESKLIGLIDQYKDITCICFESPYRILKTLSILKKNFPNLKITIAREISKIHEDIKSGDINQVYEYYKEKTSIKGEITIVCYNE